MWIAGIDIAKHNHEAFVIDHDGNPVGSAFSFANTSSGIKHLLEQINKRNNMHDPLEFGMEATGHYWIPLYSQLVAAGYIVHVLNPIQTDSLRKIRIRQTKTDAIDAQLIAEVVRFGHYTETALTNPDLNALRELCRYRFTLVDNTSDLKRRVIAMMDQIFPEYEKLFSNMFGCTSKAILEQLTSPEAILALECNKLAEMLETLSRHRFSTNKAAELQDAAAHSIGVHLGADALVFAIRQSIAHIRFLEEQLASLDEQIATTYSCFPATIDTIPGIGKVLGAVIYSEIGDIQAFDDCTKLVAYAGIDPTVHQSGNFTGSHNRMSKRGSPYLRRAIWLAATVSAFHDPVMSAYYQKKRSEGKAHGTAIGAVCRKMLYVIFAVMKAGRPYHPPVASAI